MASLADALVSLSKTTQKLNTATEELNTRIEFLEQALAKMGIGIETWLSFRIYVNEGETISNCFEEEDNEGEEDNDEKKEGTSEEDNDEEIEDDKTEGDEEDESDEDDEDESDEDDEDDEDEDEDEDEEDEDEEDEEEDEDEEDEEEDEDEDSEVLERITLKGYNLGYCKIGTSWKIAVKKINVVCQPTGEIIDCNERGHIEKYKELYDIDCSEPYALTNAPRVVRAEAAQYIDRLIDYLGKQATSLLQRIELGKNAIDEAMSQDLPIQWQLSPGKTCGLVSAMQLESEGNSGKPLNTNERVYVFKV